VILPDVNVLVYAFRDAAPNHDRYAAWLNGIVAGDDELALHDLPLSGMVRIVTNSRIVGVPAPTRSALAFVQALAAAPRRRWLSSGPATWAAFDRLATADRGIAGNLIPDAFLASLAIAHGCRLATADRGFARFAGLDWFDPAADK
jgi:toxin-antitoxin system PIN domain toxin